MIKITKKIGSPIPDILRKKGVFETDIYKSEFDKGVIDFKFKPEIYGHNQVKENLRELQDQKCCFCESKISHISYGDVEHYRPKGGWVQNNEPINKPGYYWLAYDWDNLLLSCQVCNQRYKKNYFPLSTPANRALNHRGNILYEDPQFIHPVIDQPEDHIEFNEEIPKPKDTSLKGQITIEKLGLDRELLNEQRRQKFNSIILIYSLAKGHPETDQKEAAKSFIKESQLNQSEYASMVRCYFRKNPIDF